MIMTRFCLAATLLASGWFTSQQSLQAADVAITSQIDVHVTPQEDFGAVRLQMTAQDLPARSPQQILLMVDTSASQVGEYRTQSIELISKVLPLLPASAKVAVWAIDVQQSDLTDGFVRITPEVVASVQAKLEQRIPAGSTNLTAALTSGLQSLEADQTAEIIYVGDGYSAANLISPKRMRAMTSALVDYQVPFHSYAIGAQVDFQLLGILSLRSGGALIADVSQSDADLASRSLASAVGTPIWYPTTIQMSDNCQLLPQVALPIRTDRETIYLTRLTDNQPISIELADESGTTVKVGQGAKRTETGDASLKAMYSRAIQDQGISVALAGEVVLESARQMFESELSRMLTQAQRAAEQGNQEQATEIAQQLLKIDENNKAASSLMNVQQVALFQENAANAPGNAPVGEDDQTGTAPGNANNAQPAPGNNSGLEDRTDAPSELEQDLINRFRNRTKIAGEKLSLNASRTIQEARLLAADDPDAALSLLKGLQGTVRTASDIDPDLRNELERRVGNVVLEIRKQREKILTDRVKLQQDLAEQEARRRVIEDMMLEEERLEQLIDQVRALLDDGYHGNPAAYAEAEAVAEAAVDLVPFSGAANSARFTAEAAGQLEDARYLRLLRADRFLETLTQVEFSHVPFPDEPPIRWPSAPVWKALTERRRIWASVDLKDDSPAERRIRTALEEDTELQFVDTPLIDALQIIGEQHNITILPDEIALEDEGVSTDEPVNLFISGVRLKSALRIMLEKLPAELTWIVEDEVMKITTQLVAIDKVETRVYPVGDLVISPATMSQNVGSGGGGLGGFGGGQQGGGQQGGGQFGGGGGQFGGGGGGGFFSIPDPAVKKN